MLTKLKATKAKPPSLFSDGELTALFPSSNQDDVVKCQCFLALQEVYNNEDLDVDALLVQKTFKVMVFAKKDLKAKYVKMIPCPETPNALSTKAPSLSNVKSGLCKFHGTTFWITSCKPLNFLRMMILIKV